jgi:hypothetical protein
MGMYKAFPRAARLLGRMSMVLMGVQILDIFQSVDFLFNFDLSTLKSKIQTAGDGYRSVKAPGPLKFNFPKTDLGPPFKVCMGIIPDLALVGFYSLLNLMIVWTGRCSPTSCASSCAPAGMCTDEGTNTCC